MQRREFILGLGGAAAWPVVARGQQAALPVVGIQNVGLPDQLEALFRALANSGFVDGQNVRIEHRWADGHYDLLPKIAAEFVSMRVAVLAAMGSDIGVRAAKEATSTIPIVFAIGGDPVQLGLVASLSRPGGNITGATWITGPLAVKRLGLLRHILPAVTTVSMLVNPDNSRAAFDVKDALDAARDIGWEIVIGEARSESDFEPVFATFEHHRAAAVLVVGDSFFYSHRQRLVALAARHAIPAIYSLPQYAEAGGLMSYGANFAESHLQAGTYIGRILRGEKPADLPVQLPTKFELVINMKTAKALGLTLPAAVLALVDRVIE
jgi:putative ABC transport system substrate-binding protein